MQLLRLLTDDVWAEIPVRARPDRDFGPHVIRQQSQQLHRSLRGLEREGFRHVHVLKSLEEIEAAIIERQPLWNDLKHEHGPFDIIGDVHGCFDELIELLTKLGYEFGVPASAGTAIENPKSVEFTAALPPEGGTPNIRYSQGRKIIFVGD